MVHATLTGVSKSAIGRTLENIRATSILEGLKAQKGLKDVNLGFWRRVFGAFR